MSWPEFVAQKPLWWRALLACAALYAGLCVLLFLAQRRLIYQPSKRQSELPAGFGEWHLDGKFWGYRRTNGADRCLFFFQGNGGNASGWAHAVVEFPGDIFVLEYPGYGKREGVPTEGGLKAAALKGFEAEQGKYRSVFVCGQSLGAAVTEAIFTRHPKRIDGLVLVTPFLSLSEMARAQFAFVPTKWILRDKMELFDRWLKFSGRSVVVLAGHDEIIPRKQSVAYAAARAENRKIIEIAGASHNTLELDGALWNRILEEDF